MTTIQEENKESRTLNFSIVNVMNQFSFYLRKRRTGAVQFGCKGPWGDR